MNKYEYEQLLAMSLETAAFYFNDNSRNNNNINVS